MKYSDVHSHVISSLGNQCLISIIIPVYNMENYIRPCLESVLRQNLDESTYEIIIVNDGTEDHSMEMILDLIDRQSNIFVINQENLGVSDARNNGISRAKGEYILMIDPDDLLIDDSLQLLLEKAIESKADLVVADFLEMTDEEIENNKVIPQKEWHVEEKSGERLFLEDLNPRQCYVWRTLFRREFILENHLQFVPGIRYQDVPFTHECYLKAKKCLRVSRLLNIYRRGHESATFSFNSRKAKDLCIAIASTWKLKKIETLSPDVRNKLENNIFASFSLLIYFMLYGIKSSKERKEIFAFLRKEIPELSFSNGLKQKVTSVLYNDCPNFYFWIRKLLIGCTPKPNF